MIVRTFVRAIRPVNEGEGSRTPFVIWRTLATAAIITGAVVGMSIVGFFPAMIAMSALLVPILQVKNVKLYVLACGVVLAFVYVVFSVVLNVPLSLLLSAGI